MSATEMPHAPSAALNTSEGARRFIADFFATELHRHDFSDYISTRLAADFACALAQHLAATGKQQVGEVQGDARAALEASMPYLETLHSIVGGEARTSVWRCIERGRLALAARQPGAQVPVATVHVTHGGFGMELATHVAYALPVGTHSLYAAPPAQGIDLGRALDIMWNWQEQLGGHVFDARDVARTLTSSDMQAIGVDARACIDATDRNQAIVLAKREIVRALSGGQRDAAPGVGE